jgi:hypothetical protein
LEQVWKIWKSLESLERRRIWNLCKLRMGTLCSLDIVFSGKGHGVFFLVKSYWLLISPRPFAGICVFVGRWFATCLHFWLGHATPYSPKVANHFVSCAQVHCHAPSRCCFVWLYYIFRNLHSRKKEKCGCLVCGF